MMIVKSGYAKFEVVEGKNRRGRRNIRAGSKLYLYVWQQLEAAGFATKQVAPGVFDIADGTYHVENKGDN